MEGKEGKKGWSLQGQKEDLKLHTKKFQMALDQYNQTSSHQEKDHLKQVMDQEIGLIDAMAQEIGERGIQKQNQKIKKSYSVYTNQISNEAFFSLEHDLITFREQLGQ